MTADTFSNGLGFLLMGTGNDNNTWGSNQNTAVFQIFEDAISGALTSAVTGGTLDLSGSPPPAAASQARYGVLVFTGVLGSNQVVQVPNLRKSWLVQNATSAAFTLKFKTPSGSASGAIPQNSGWQVVQCDGADGIVVHPFNTKQIQMPDGTVSLPAYSNVNEPASGWYRAGTQDWRFAINGVDVLQATGTGASSPSIFNVLSPNTLQVAGAQLLPPGIEQPYAGIALPAGGWLWEDGTAYSRATYAALFSALTATATGDTHTSTALDNLSVDLRGKGLDGAYIEGTGIPSGTTIAINSASSITLSQAAASSLVGVSLRIIPYGQGDGSTTFNVPDRRYRALVGRDNMNNNPASRSSTFAGTHLNTTGGEESHTLTTPEIPSHTHTVNDTGHTHTVPSRNGSGGPTSLATVGAAATEHTIATDSATTGITNANTGGGTSHNNMQPFGVTNYIIKT